MEKGTKKMTAYAMLLALSMILGYLESMIPTPFPIPGIKLGLANIVNIIGLFSLGILPTGIISFLRVLLLSMLFGNLMTLSYSMAGFFLSFFVMVLAKQCFKLSFISVSLLGGIFHNIGQILMAAFLLRNPVLFAITCRNGSRNRDGSFGFYSGETSGEIFQRIKRIACQKQVSVLFYKRTNVPMNRCFFVPSCSACFCILAFGKEKA